MERKKVLETILVLVLALIVVYWFIHDSSPQTARWMLVASFVLGFIGLFIPALAGLIHNGWMKLAEAMGFVMSKVLLTLIFAIFVIPLAFMSRVFGKRNVIKLKKGSPSYFVERNYTYTKESMENVW